MVAQLATLYRAGPARSSCTALLLAVVSAIVLILAGQPAQADDSELFLSDPDATTAKANVLFIIDTSGSMATLVATQAPFDSATTFGGCYRSDSVYFSTSGTAPACDSVNHVPKTANFCAAGRSQLDRLGYYADALLSWDASRELWDTLDAARRDDPLECEADRGADGAGPAGERFAANGPGGPWAVTAAQEPAWNTRYTIYDGNWLNWSTNPPTVEKSRLDIVKEAVGNLLGSLKNVNIGVMRFNRDEGGRVVAAIDDIGTSQASVENIVNQLSPGGATPLSETLYEAAQYFRGAVVDYGNVTDPGVTDPRSVAASRVGNDPNGIAYRSPITEACGKNFIVLLTDGEPSFDDGAVAKITGLPGFATTVAPACDGSGEGLCLDDLAAYLARSDLNPDLPGVQSVTTHTIGFTLDFPLLATTAARGGGEYHLADDTASLSTALSGIVLSIFDNVGTFAAPAVPVNAFNRTQNLSDVYLSVFQPTERARWTGNLKKYRIADGRLVGQDGQPVIDPVTGLFARDAISFWSAEADGDRAGDGGAASRLPDSDDRRLFSNLAGNSLSATANRVDSDNLDPGDPLVEALTDVPAGEQRALIEWARGRDVRDEDQDGDVAETRRDMGDALHGQPLTVFYSGTAEDPVGSVFIATNDGYLHSFDTETGDERWAFIPSRLLNNLYTLYRNEAVPAKRYGLDGEISAYTLNDDGKPGLLGPGEKAILVFGMGRGGDGVFAIDITDRDNPALLWEINDKIAGFGKLGQTWSTPSVARVRLGDSPRTVAVFGGGYDPGQDNGGYRTDAVGNAIYMVDLLTGELLWSAGVDNPVDDHDLKLPLMVHSIPAPTRPLDLTGDGFADRMYVGDMGGRLWRFDIVNGREAADLVEGGVLASLGGAANPTPANLRRFYEAPDVVPAIIEQRRVTLVNIGSGYRGHPLDTTVNEAFFSVRDFYGFRVIDTADYPATPVLVDQLADITNDAAPELAFSTPGWQLRLVQGDGEKVLGESLTLDNLLFFTSFTPGETASECTGGSGVNRLYAISVLDGAPRTNFDMSVDGEELTVADRSKVLTTGIPVTDVNRYQGETAGESTIFAGTESLTAEEIAGLGLRLGQTVRRTYWFQDESQ